jgi:hypothetical protein
VCPVSFFDSDIVRAEMTEISILQDDIYRNVFTFPTMNAEEKKFHISLLEKLLNKQRVLYTRLSLSDDPEAVEMKERIIESAQMMGMPSNVDMSVIFNNMSKLIETMKSELDISEEVE